MGFHRVEGTLVVQVIPNRVTVISIPSAAEKVREVVEVVELEVVIRPSEVLEVIHSMVQEVVITLQDTLTHASSGPGLTTRPSEEVFIEPWSKWKLPSTGE